MTFLIRPVRVSDASQIHAIRRQVGVYPNMLSLPSERSEGSERFLTNLTDNEHIFVAVSSEDDNLVLGLIGLHVSPRPRMRHSGSIGLSVHQDHQGKGIGKALMATVIDLSDNWLLLKRLELGVLDGNERAMSLYKSFGFEVEGVKRACVVRAGTYVDETLMSRIRL